MKTKTFLLITIFFIGLFSFQISAQDENKQQLWLCHVEKVKPSKFFQFIEVSKELVEACQKADFPFSFYKWQTNNMVFESWYPINSINDISKIFEAWEKVGMPEEKEKLYFECIESFQMTTFSFVYKYSLPPKNDLLIPDNIEYCRWQELQYQLGTHKDFFTEMDKMMEMQEEFGEEDDIIYAIYGEMGFNNPSFILANLAENRKLFEEMSEESYKNFSDEQKNKLQESNLRILDLCNDYKMKELFKMSELCYLVK